jgi:hypothetical protein
MAKSHGLRRVVFLVAGIFVIVNVLAYGHATSLLIYAEKGQRVKRLEDMSAGEKVKVLLTGVAIARPENKATPAALGLRYESITLMLASTSDEALELWHIPSVRDNAPLALVFHGHGAAKDSMLNVAHELHGLGLDVVMPDFRGSGGSSRRDVTIGIREGEDVAAVVAFAKQRWPGRPQVLYGFSMGSAAVLRAVAHHEVRPNAIVLEAPFDRMRNAVGVRLNLLGIPAFPAADIMTFWGGARLGYNGFAHNPAADATAIACPTLVIHGLADPVAPRAMVDAIVSANAEHVRLGTLAGIGHYPGASVQPAAWRALVSRFLADSML